MTLFPIGQSPYLNIENEVVISNSCCLPNRKIKIDEKEDERNMCQKLIIITRLH